MDRDTTRRELLDWLGDTSLTDEQMDRLVDAATDIDQRYPDQDEQGERDAALSATLQYLLGETTAEDAARTLIDARSAEARAYAAAVQMAVMLRGDGEAKATAARRAGVDRMSLLKALGER